MDILPCVYAVGEPHYFSKGGFFFLLIGIALFETTGLAGGFRTYNKLRAKLARSHGIHLHVMVTEDELDTIHQRMAETEITNAEAYIRKMALNGYVLNVDLAPIRELVSLQRRCANNLNQVAIHANTYGVYPSEIAALQKDYAELWGRVSDVLKQLAAVVEL